MQRRKGALPSIPMFLGILVVATILLIVLFYVASGISFSIVISDRQEFGESTLFTILESVPPSPCAVNSKLPLKTIIGLAIMQGGDKVVLDSPYAIYPKQQDRMTTKEIIDNCITPNIKAVFKNDFFEFSVDYPLGTRYRNLTFGAVAEGQIEVSEILALPNGGVAKVSFAGKGIVDNAGPEIKAFEISDLRGITVNGARRQAFDVLVGATDASGISEIQILYDGGLVKTCPPFPSPGTCTHTVIDPTKGTHKVTVIAKDNSPTKNPTNVSGEVVVQ